MFTELPHDAPSQVDRHAELSVDIDSDIPLTPPLNPSELNEWSPPDVSADYEDIGEDEDRKDTGRISEANLQIVQAAFVEVQNLAKDAATKTGLSTSQVFDLWASSDHDTHDKSNTWNMYGAYFEEHKVQELARLEGGKVSSLSNEGTASHLIFVVLPGKCASTVYVRVLHTCSLTWGGGS